MTLEADRPGEAGGGTARDARLNALAALPTPAVVVEHARLLRNIGKMQSIAKTAGLALRPHIKTHKCLEIAQLQMQAGAVGVTASKPGEALVFIQAGVPSVTVAYPIVEAGKAERLMTAAKQHGCDLRFIADSEAGLAALEGGAQAAGYRPGLFLKIDVGLHRVGLPADSPLLLPLARRMSESLHVDFRGLLSHAGHAYGAGTPGGVAAVAEEERRLLLQVQERLRQAGIAVAELSVGSTPTTMLAESFEGLSELRPGNYVFYDLTAFRLGAAAMRDISLSVLASVVSVREGRAIVDAGSKVLSSDLGPHGTGGVTSYGLAFPVDSGLDAEDSEGLPVEKLSEEHGFLRLATANLKVGDRVRIVPNHSCPVANLAERLYALADDGGVAEWPVAAGRKVQ